MERQNLERLTQADMMMGFTSPRKYGGLNCPILIYTIAGEIVARGDGSFYNLFGLQGIADTIYAFANDEIKDKYLPKFSAGEVTGAMVLTEPDAVSENVNSVAGRLNLKVFYNFFIVRLPTPAKISARC
jgi:alkylation response protein AidB-like acyl-CoA dehydrogenase